MSYASVGDIEGPVDGAIVMVPSDAAEEAVLECVDAGSRRSGSSGVSGRARAATERYGRAVTTASTWSMAPAHSCSSNRSGACTASTAASGGSAGRWSCTLTGGRRQNEREPMMDEELARPSTRRPGATPIGRVDRHDPRGLDRDRGLLDGGHRRPRRVTRLDRDPVGVVAAVTLVALVASTAQSGRLRSPVCTAIGAVAIVTGLGIGVVHLLRGGDVVLDPGRVGGRSDRGWCSRRSESAGRCGGAAAGSRRAGSAEPWRDRSS